MDYTNFRQSYDANLINSWKKDETEMSVDTLRGLLYGFTFTQDYAKGDIEDALFMDYWRDKHLKERNADDDDYSFSPQEEKEFDPMDEIMDAVNNVDLYEVDTPQEHLLMEVLDSTGDGKTPETAISVIDVSQEYEYLERKFPYSCIHTYKQELCNGIDCLYFKENVYGIKCIYFDIKRKFEVRSQQ